jgi:urea transporter
MMLLAVSAFEKLQNVPPTTWMKVGIGLAAVVLVVLVVQHVLKMNKIIMGVIVFVVCTVVLFSWVYNRNEPKWATPVVEKIAPFFPSANAYQTKQQR